MIRAPKVRSSKRIALMHEADAITDAESRRSFLTLIPENRAITALWEQSAKRG